MMLQILSFFKQGFLRFLILICPLINSQIAFAQNPLNKRFFNENNGVTGAIYDVFQDKRGFIWLGTENGLARFDGKKIVFFAAPKNYDKSVTNLFEDKYGVIYCQNFSGHYFKTTLKSDSLKLIAGISKFGNIKQGVLINDSLIGCVSKSGISFFNISKNRIQVNFPNSNELQPSTLKGKTNSYAIIVPDKNTISFYYPNGNKVVKKFKSNNVGFYHILFHNKNLLIGKRPPFILENLESGELMFLKDVPNSTIINHLSVIDANHFVLLTTNGLYLYNSKFQLIQHYFEQESISGILVDQQKNWWISTLNKGLILVSQPQTTTFLNNTGFKSIAFKHFNLLAGTRNNEIYEINSKNKYTNLIYKDSAIHEVRDIHFNSKRDEIVFSNQRFNLIRNNQIQKYAYSVSDVFQINDNTYILSEGFCLSLFPLTERDSLYKIFKQPSIDIYYNRLALTKVNTRVRSSVFADNDKIISITSKGLFCFKGTHQFKLLHDHEKIKAVSLAKLSNDSILIATPINGILLYSNGSVSQYIKPQLYNNEEVYMMKIFESKVFIVTYRGIHVLNSKGIKLKDQYLSDGFHGVDLVDFVHRNDTTFIANVSGVVISPLNSYYKNNKPPPIFITEGKINGKPFDFASEQKFEYNSYFFEFNFCVLDYRGIESTKAYYRVNEGNWIKASENKILLTALEPNSYKIQIKAINDRGIESDKPMEISFVIQPPFYRTIWFFLFVFSIVVVSSFLLFRSRLKTISKQSALLSQKTELEKALRNSTLSGIKAQMNPHFIFNALNTIQSYIYLNDKKTAGDYLVSFSELMRSILEMSTKDYIQLSEELKALNLYLRLEKMRFEEDFNYFVNVNEEVEDSYKIPSMLIQPYVENAIKHGLLHKKGPKKLEIHFYKKNSSLVVEVIDNGIGLEASLKLNAARSKMHTPFATKANQLRLELLNANSKGMIGVETVTLRNESEQVIGTKVIIKIPSDL